MRTTLERIELERSRPTPATVLAPGEEPTAVAAVDGDRGWVAVTDRELLLYHPEREPPLSRVPRPNVTALTLARVGGEEVLPYVPRLFAFGLGSLVAGVLLSGFGVPVSTGAEEVSSLLSLLATALSTVASGLLLLGGLLVVFGLGAVGYVLYLREPVLVVERLGGEPFECPTAEREGRRALERLAAAIEREATDRSRRDTGPPDGNAHA